MTNIITALGQEELKTLLGKCKDCDGPIIYENTRISSNKKVYGKHKNTVKTTGHRLQVCEACIIEKFPKYESMNKSRVFNRMNVITKYAFDIEDDVYNQEFTKFVKNTIETFKEKYNKDWKTHWDIYRNKQSIVNTFDYKKNVHGWSKEQFKKFNKSRAVTKKNLINKYGEEKGMEKYNDYLDLQKETKSFSYMCEKFGIKRAKEINKSKGHTLWNYITKYGEVLGKEKFSNYAAKKQAFASNIANDFFDNLDTYFQDYTTYYDRKNQEYGVNLDTKYIKLDYYILELNIAVEFHGNIFHANPLIYGNNAKPNPFNQSITAEEIWKVDEERNLKLYESRKIKTIIVWESEFTESYDFKKLSNKIKEYARK